MGQDDTILDKKKVHRERHSGRKAEKKKSKKDGENKPIEISDKQRNPKAFAFNSAVRAERRFRRKQDIETKKQHIPVIDRTPIEPPPILIAIVGPPKVGKSTVINNLIKLFTKSPLTDIKGPVTIVTGKKRRITLIECNNDINSMIDIAKVADLVLLLCDASFGFEMEIFEFLNICQVHGMPRIMGVLTHLDMIKNSKTLKNTKKVLKHRFWTEVYPGAKLFYLSGIVHGEYLRNEIKNLGRFVSIIKFRPLTWRSTHSYLLGDRYEDLTSQELIRQNPKCDRNISLYGYIRGVPLSKNTTVHIAGLGDLKIYDVSYLPDPCPLPDVLKKRSLNEKEKLIYAPFSGVGGIVYDKDAVYVELGGSHSHKKDPSLNNESKNMVSNLIDAKETLDVKMQHSEMQIFTGGKKLTADDLESFTKRSSKSSMATTVKNTVDSDLDEELEELRKEKDYSGLKEETVVEAGRSRRRVIFDKDDKSFADNLQDDNSESEDDDEGFEQKKTTDYTVLKQNKDKDVYDKVTDALRYLDKKRPAPTSDLEDYDSDEELKVNSDSDMEDYSDEDEESNGDEQSDVPDDISLESGESLVGVCKMKHKEKLIDVEDINKGKKHIHFDDSEDDEVLSKKKKKKLKKQLDNSNDIEEETEFASNIEENNLSRFEDSDDDKDKEVSTKKKKKKSKKKLDNINGTKEEIEFESNIEENNLSRIEDTDDDKEKEVTTKKKNKKSKKKLDTSNDTKEETEFTSNIEENNESRFEDIDDDKEKEVSPKKKNKKSKKKLDATNDTKEETEFTSNIEENNESRFEDCDDDKEKEASTKKKNKKSKKKLDTTNNTKEETEFASNKNIEDNNHIRFEDSDDNQEKEASTKKKNKKSKKKEHNLNNTKEEVEFSSNKNISIEDIEDLPSDDDSLNLSDDETNVSSDNEKELPNKSINKEQTSSSEESDDENINVKWKENLTKKARDAFIDRQRTTQNIMKLVYGVFDKHSFKLDEEPSKQDEEEDIGGLFRLVTTEQKRKAEEKERRNIEESALFNPWNKEARDWLDAENKILISNCFVTGKWKQSEDASELLKLDELRDFSDEDEVFGDFEDLETGEKHSAEEPKTGEKRKHEETETEPVTRKSLIEKKRKLKEKFDAEYDNTENTSYYDDLKTSAEKQAQINKAVFEDMSDDLRVQIEGFRAGMYVRIEFQDVPSEFISNFDPTYPLVIGGLNIGEENVGYVNVKIKKHRWYKKILKTADPLIISLGWRRFQTLPLFSKLEDDLKYRYLKYTPEHVNCNAHFWGPITPQGTGFLALQTVNGQLENVKQLGFRIAATGNVQELEKSTQIMKKLKLIGHPTKIYKKTAFVKDMFNSALEVAKFEGARIKTVSGIRGQIKKAAGKPEGSFRATFEDKILLSDIVFCRTWYKVDVPKFYCPVTTLLLPPEQKNAWQGVRTTGQLKKERGIQNAPNMDSLYTPIERVEKPSKPLIIPRKLQKQLPYRDKPKFAPLKSDRKPDVEKKRVAVVREPHEQKVANMLKMLRASYEHKQAQMKTEMSKRISMHQAQVNSQEAKKHQREKRERKEIFRKKSKAKIREEKKGGKK